MCVLAINKQTLEKESRRAEVNPDLRYRAQTTSARSSGSAGILSVGNNQND